tara:strand:+ start:609 stop:809 length:201 start_codon:yes stop_codon:yes gene_type:complete
MNYPKLAKYKEGGPMSEDCYEDGGIGDFFRKIKGNVGKRKYYKKMKGMGKRCSKSKRSKVTRTRGR